MAESGVKLFFFNYISSDILAYSDVSSEQASFPAENIYSKQRRSKVWRSAGNFDVTSSNNQIVFRETSGGPDLTATLTVASYASISAMCAEIKAALEVAGDSTYTVTNSTSTGFKFNIVSNGAGGSGVFQLMCSNVGFTSASLLGFDTSADLTSATLTRTSDFLRINSSEWLLWDMGLSTNPKAFIVIGPRNSPLKISPSATLTLQASHSDAWTTPGFEQVLTYNDQAIYHVNSAGIGDQAYRYWRLKIEDENPNGYIEIGAAFLGNYFNPSRGRVQFPFSFNVIDDSDTIVSEGGQTYSDIKQTTASYQLSWFGLEKEDVEEFEEQFQEYGTNKPFFVALDSDAVFSTSANKRVIFAKIVSDPSSSLISPNNFELTVNIKESL